VRLNMETPQMEQSLRKVRKEKKCPRKFGSNKKDKIDAFFQLASGRHAKSKGENLGRKTPKQRT